MKQNRVCLAPGYKYEYTGTPRSTMWKSSKDDWWDTVMFKAVCGKLLGKRRIDGAQVAVVRAAGKVYASQHIKTPKGVQMAGARRRWR
jgi:hypothetical protein